MHNFFIHLFLYNLCVINSNLSDNILYFGDLYLKISKTQNGCQNVKKTPFSMVYST